MEMLTKEVIKGSLKKMAATGKDNGISEITKKGKANDHDQDD